MDQSILTSFLVLAIFVVILFLISIYLKKLQKNKIKKIGNYEGKVIGRIPLTQKASLFIVKVGEQTFLIGLAEKNITFISELSPKEQPTTELINNLKNNSNKPISENIDLIKPIENQSLSFSSFLKTAFNKNN
ncbi:MAG TPA: flagellar biosynthetic protein FliO [Candidatus Kapabacteria bacterium]|jgi:flagellar biogenesis protein FliO|nr:flagellar biosynthetic protein FliO [Candidatus Kapabacteria bacterium]